MRRATTIGRTRIRLLIAGVLAALVGILPLPAADAATRHDNDVVVMTQNLYLGSSLVPALTATTPQEFIAGAAQIYATVQYTNFPARAAAIADEIAVHEPDLIGLQEVTRWTTAGPNAPPGYDFLAILQAALNARGLHYSVAAVSNNSSIGPVPLPLPGCVAPGPTITCSVGMDDRDVIMANDDTAGLSWRNPRSGIYEAQQAIDSPVGPLLFDRGWASIDARLDGQPFRFVTTHLETETFPATQQAQAAEFLAGPAKGGTIIAVGDFNSAADGSTTATYAQLTRPGKFRDAWHESAAGSGASCCQVSNTPPLAPGALNNPVSTLQTRIDLILGRGAARAVDGGAALVGTAPFQSSPPFWPSDHGGVVAQFHL